MRLQHIDLRRGENKVTEATVHWLLETEMIERINEVSPVKMSVDTEHLTEDRLADLDKVGWEAAALTNPVARASKF